MGTDQSLRSSRCCVCVCYSPDFVLLIVYIHILCLLKKDFELTCVFRHRSVDASFQRVHYPDQQLSVSCQRRPLYRFPDVFHAHVRDGFAQLQHLQLFLHLGFSRAWLSPARLHPTLSSRGHPTILVDRTHRSLVVFLPAHGRY